MQGIFQESSLIKNEIVDVEGVMKSFDRKVMSDEWRKVMKDAFTTCYAKVMGMDDYIADVYKRVNFNKEQCDVRYDAIATCIEISAFYVKLIIFCSGSSKLLKFIFRAARQAPGMIRSIVVQPKPSL